MDSVEVINEVPLPILSVELEVAYQFIVPVVIADKVVWDNVQTLSCVVELIKLGREGVLQSNCMSTFPLPEFIPELFKGFEPAL